MSETRITPESLVTEELANIIALLAEINSTRLEDAPPIQAIAWKQAGLVADCVEG